VLFLDEPAVVTRDSVIRPRLKNEPNLAHELTPELVRDAFLKHFRQAKYQGGPAELLRGLSARPDVDLGDMQFLQANLFTWETMISTAVDQLGEGAGPPPWAMVFEPPGQLGTRRTLPEMNMAYGCQIPCDNTANLAGILYGFLRGGARLTGRAWGTSIYGAVDRADSLSLLTLAYDRGARLFFFWDNAQLACVPFGECLELSRQLTRHIAANPVRNLPSLSSAAESLILLPPGYNLGHVHMGRGNFWGLGELNLERTNRLGVTYRTVMHNAFTEMERSVRLGLTYDLAWDVPGLNFSGYRELVRVREDGQVEVHSGANRVLRDGPRTPDRPEGSPPGLSLTLKTMSNLERNRIRARASVVQRETPVFYTIHHNKEGGYDNAVVLWELFGPRDEDYRALLNDGVRPEIQWHGSACDVDVEFLVRSPGRYRLRAAVSDTAGRTAVVWQQFSF
jgi:hypothetical protein